MKGGRGQIFDTFITSTIVNNAIGYVPG